MPARADGVDRNLDFRAAATGREGESLRGNPNRSKKPFQPLLRFIWIKYELVYHHRFATRAQARTAIFDYIETFYNRTRLHSSLDYQSPINFESKLN
jgi:transposase InsO family protein